MKNVYKILFAVVGILILTFTYNGKIFLGNNDVVNALPANSELLVNGAIDNQYLGGVSTGYGLGWLYPYNALSDKFEAGSYLTDVEVGIRNGYGEKEKLIAVADNEFNRENYVEGNWLEFSNGAKYKVTKVSTDEAYLYVWYDADHILTEGECGRLYYIRVLSADGQLLVNSRMGIYEAQFGLQGKIFRELLAVVPYRNAYPVFHILAAFGMAAVTVLLCAGLWKKYEPLCAAVFYAVCLLSPWMIGFSSNLYWVMFTWFLPMAIGLICSNYQDRRLIRLGCYIGIFGAVAVKSLCGYEYITTIMLSSVVFLLSDFISALIKKREKAEIKCIFFTLFGAGVSAMGGFVAALCLHAKKRGGGSLTAGLISIYEKDVVRRTYGGDAAVFGDAYTDSLNASVWEVLGQYFHFTTPVFTGVTGKIFIPMLIAAVLLLFLGVRKKVFQADEICVTVTMFLASISWFVLGKSHSAAHGHLNFVMWYMGFLQMIVFIIVKGVWSSSIKGRLKIGRYGNITGVRENNKRLNSRNGAQL